MTVYRLRNANGLALFFVLFSLIVTIPYFSVHNSYHISTSESEREHIPKMNHYHTVITKSSHSSPPINIEKGVTNRSDLIVYNTRPNSKIENLDLINTSLLIINSPGVVVQNNVLNISLTSFPFAIQLINSPNARITNNTIHQVNSDFSTRGIVISNSSRSYINDNRINNIHTTSIVDTASYGILLDDSILSTVINNIITEVTSPAAYGIFINGSDGSQIIKNKISNLYTFNSIYQSEVAGILIGVSNNIIVEENHLYHFRSSTTDGVSIGWGINLVLSNFSKIIYNMIEDLSSASVSPEITAIDIYGSSDVEIRDNQLSGLEVSTLVHDEAFTTGIYLLFTERIKIWNNSIFNMNSIGRASFGIFSERSTIIEISSNSIFKISAVSNIRATSIGIVLKVGEGITVRQNDISEISALGTNIDFSSTTSATAIGISVDRIDVSNIEKNTFHVLHSQTNNNQPVDVIGLITANSKGIIVDRNHFSELSTSHSSDSLMNIIIIWNTLESDFIENEIDSIKSSYYLGFFLLIGSQDIKIANNDISEMDISSDVISFSLLNSDDIRVSKNQIILQVSDIHYIFSSSINSEGNYYQGNHVAIDNTTNSLVFEFDRSPNQHLIDNNFGYIENWISKTDSKQVYCENNYLNKEIISSDCEALPIPILPVLVEISTMVSMTIIVLLIRKRVVKT